METVHSINLIATNPEVRHGRPCIAGTGIEVAALVIAHIVHQRTPDQIATDYDLSLAQVYAALSYYYAHKAEMDALIQDRSRIAQEMKEKGVGSRHSSLSG
ncbi:DUF433 domain-containing protein [bacterium]|nr:DUF433 domain-containing protein [bacterium]